MVDKSRSGSPGHVRKNACYTVKTPAIHAIQEK